MFENCEAAVRISDEKGPIWEKKFRFKPQPKCFPCLLTQIKKKNLAAKPATFNLFVRKLLILNLLRLKV